MPARREIKGETAHAGMLCLVNTPVRDQPALVDVLADAARSAAVKRGSWTAVSCYFDEAGLKAAIASMASGVSGPGGRVDSVAVFIDVGEWIRARVSVERLQAIVASAAGVASSRVSISPVDFPGQLLHAKAYAIRRTTGANPSGFVAVTSGNATERGIGIGETTNVELVTVVSDTESVRQFGWLVAQLSARKVSTEKALANDEILRAIRLFTSGVFFHRWQGSLSGDLRLQLALTPAGRKAKKTAFRGYESDSGSISKEPLDLASAHCGEEEQTRKALGPVRGSLRERGEGVGVLRLMQTLADEDND